MPPRFTPTDLGLQGTSPASIAGAFQQAYYDARQDLRAQQRMENETARLDIETQRFGQQTEDRAWENENLRHFRVSESSLGVVAKALSLQSAQQQIQLGELKIGEELQMKGVLQKIMGDMAGYQAQKQQGAAPTEAPAGAVTHYGYAWDKYIDSNSMGWNANGYPTGAWNNRLDQDSFGISPDVERKFKAMGIKAKDWVNLQLDDGTVVRKRWDDRTMEDADAIRKYGKPFTGRFDFYSPTGPGKMEGRKVVAFSLADGAANNLTTAVAAPSTPNGVPTYAAAAAAVNPAAAISQSFTPTQNKFLNYYDNLKIVAGMRGNTADGLQASMLMRQMENNPEFQDALGRRELMLTAARNQAQINQTIMGSRVDQVEDFQSVYPWYKLQRLPNGQVLPLNSATGQPLNPQEQMAFNQAFMEHKQKFNPAKSVDKLSAVVQKDYAKYQAMYAAGANVTGNSDEEIKLRRQAEGALRAMQTLERLNPGLAQQAAQQAAEQAVQQAAEQAALQQPEVDDTASLTVEQLRDRAKNAEVEKANQEKFLQIDAELNTFANNISKAEGLPVTADNIANEVIGNTAKKTGKKSTQYVSSEGGGAAGWEVEEEVPAAQFYASQLGIQPQDIVEWAKTRTKSRKAAQQRQQVSKEAKELLQQIFK